jgi:hypothetical protein
LAVILTYNCVIVGRRTAAGTLFLLLFATHQYPLSITANTLINGAITNKAQKCRKKSPAALKTKHHNMSFLGS